MNRREFLAVGTITGITSATGCLGYTIESEENIQQRQEEIDQLEDTAQQRQEEIDQLDEELESIRSERDDLSEEIETTTRENLLTIYELAEDAYNQAESDIDDGISFLEDDDYATASIRCAYAQQAYNEAKFMLEEITDPTNEQSSEAGNIVEESYEYCDTAASISLNLVDTAYYYNIGETDQAQDTSDQAQSLSNSLTADFESSDDFEDALMS